MFIRISKVKSIYIEKKHQFFVADLWFISAAHEERQEYRIYDMDSFIADVGGYLGLLLGHSIYSMVGGISGLISQRIKCFQSAV